MFEIAERLIAAADAGRVLAVATAVSIDGSAPRTVATSMAYDGHSVIGSIAGGCVEAAVIAECELVLADGQPRVVDYGVSDESAFAVGLTCGGQLRIQIELLKDATADELRRYLGGRSAAISLVLPRLQGGPLELNDLTASALRRIDAERRARIALGNSALVVVDCEDETLEVFFEVSAPAPQMIIFGAMEFSAALSVAAQMLGYRVIVCDPRPLFATAERLPGAEIVVAWPTTWLTAAEVDDRSVICVLSHDARFDAELIAIALASRAGYVGAMGSRATHDRRMASLREIGVAEMCLDRLHSPIGLDIGASTVEETAIAILAEVIATRTGAPAVSLTQTQGAIHRASLTR